MFIKKFNLKKFKVHSFKLSKQIRLGMIGLLLICVLAIASMIEPAYSFFGQSNGGDRSFYGKVADTQNWGGKTGDNLVSNAKVTINASPVQTTYTDTDGQFWFNGLRDIPYTLAIDTNDGHYAFSVNLEDATSGFFDLASEARQNFQELEY